MVVVSTSQSGVKKDPEEIAKECVQGVRDHIGPVAAFKVREIAAEWNGCTSYLSLQLAIPVARLPKTRSGKILRGIIKKIADGDGTAARAGHRLLLTIVSLQLVTFPAYQSPATIDDPAILDEIEAALVDKGYAKEREVS